VRPKLYSVEMTSGGLISIMARPRGGDWLAEEMAAAKEAGLDVVVSALTTSEREELGLTAEEYETLGHGLSFVSFPIVDLGTPTLDERTKGTLAQLVDAARERRHVGVHCRMGIGRSSMIVATLLGLLGVDVDAAFDMIGRSRGLSVPETKAQRDWAAFTVQAMTHN